jgi:hypothetical protein
MSQFSHIKEDAKKDIETLEREADRARADVETTLEAIEQRLSPTELFHHAVDTVRDNGGDFGRNLATQVRNNPLPAILTGVGMAWLMAASDRPPRTRVHERTGPSVGERMSSAAASTRDATGHAAQNAKSAAHNIAEATHNVAGAARGAARNVAGVSRAGAYNVRHGYDYLRREQPLVLGALAVAAGAALGALLPSTAAEDEWIGEASDEAAERLKRQGRRTVDDAKAAAADAAEAATGAASERVRTSGPDAEDPATTESVRTSPRPADSPPTGGPNPTTASR